TRIPERGLAAEYRSMLLERFFAERRGKQGKPQKPAVFMRASEPPDAGAANFRRARLMLVTLLSHPALIPDVEEAFARVNLPANYARLRDALSGFVCGARTLDTESLFTHLSQLGLAEEARLIEAVAAEDHRPDPEASLAQVAEKWWSGYVLMDFSIEMLRSQRDELLQFFNANQGDTAVLQ